MEKQNIRIYAKRIFKKIIVYIKICATCYSNSKHTVYTIIYNNVSV